MTTLYLSSYLRKDLDKETPSTFPIFDSGRRFLRRCEGNKKEKVVIGIKIRKNEIDIRILQFAVLI